jgi:hypothetical protein
MQIASGPQSTQARPPVPHAEDDEPPKQASPSQHPPQVVEHSVGTHAPQSRGQEEHDSAASHAPLPQDAGQAPQSVEHDEHDSPPAHRPSPQNGAELGHPAMKIEVSNASRFHMRSSESAASGRPPDRILEVVDRNE